MENVKKDEEIIKNLAAVSHEIQTPVSLIKSTARFILQTNKYDRDLKQYMRNILNNCNKINLMLGNIVDINLVTVSKKEYVNIRQFMDAFFCVTRPYCRILGANIKTEFKTESEYAYIPVITVERVLLNLVSNAIKYNDKEKKNIKIKISEKKGFLVFSVKDNGIGIEEENLRKITEQFYRVDKSVSSGMGMGLSIVKRYIENMKGTLKIKSTPQKGTTVTFSVPINNDGNELEVRDEIYYHYPEQSLYDIEFSQFFDGDYSL